MRRWRRYLLCGGGRCYREVRLSGSSGLHLYCDLISEAWELVSRAVRFSDDRFPESLSFGRGADQADSVLVEILAPGNTTLKLCMSMVSCILRRYEMIILVFYTYLSFSVPMSSTLVGVFEARAS